MADWYEWKGCELVYLPLHQFTSGHWNTTSEYLGHVVPLVTDSRFSELLDTLHEPSNRLINRLVASAKPDWDAPIERVQAVDNYARSGKWIYQRIQALEGITNRFTKDEQTHLYEY